jgi:tetratricopeptide (TPR) repeat protein
MERFGSQDDVLTFFGESMMNLRPWDLWAKDGSPHEGTEEILATLERVLERNPNHIGAIHLYIHATEASPKPERSLRWADKLGQLAPNAGHLVHMPSHAYVRTGRWADALEVNRRAIVADDTYIASTGVQGLYPAMYAPHNIHFLSWAGMLAGDRDEAMSAGAELHRRGAPELFVEMPQMSLVLAWPAMIDARLGRWDAVLAAPEIDADWTYGRAMRHFARGLAQVGKGDLAAAERELAALREEAKKTPEEMLSFGLVNAASDVFRIADLVLSGRIAAAKGETDRAVALLTEAVSAEDALTYMEPSDWHAPTRHTLGAVLLGAKRFKEAERIFREDLAKTPENGWALYGLAEALKQSGDSKGAEDAMARFAKVWAKPSQGPEFGWY